MKPEFYVVIIFCLSVLGLILKMNKDFNTKADNLLKESNIKIASIFKRFDIHKDQVKKEYVSKDICKIIHSHETKEFERLEKRVDDGFKSLDDKLTLVLKNNGNKG